MSDVKTKSYNLTEAEVFIIAEALEFLLDEQGDADEHDYIYKVYERIMGELGFKAIPQVVSY